MLPPRMTLPPPAVIVTLGALLLPRLMAKLIVLQIRAAIGDVACPERDAIAGERIRQCVRIESDAMDGSAGDVVVQDISRKSASR